MQVPVYVESGNKRVFACALEWPGWCRSGKDESEGLGALATYADRYAVVARGAGVRFETKELTFTIIERLAGSATTDFGAPCAIPETDRRAIDSERAGRIVRLVEASWAAFDRAVLRAPVELRKGPRGGGRDRDKIVDHVVNAETAYAAKIGVRIAKHERTAQVQRAAIREALLSIAGAPESAPWPAAYAARRIAWHVLDHAWEIEDRAVPV